MLTERAMMSSSLLRPEVTELTDAATPKPDVRSLAERPHRGNSRLLDASREIPVAGDTAKIPGKILGNSDIGVAARQERLGELDISLGITW